MFKVISDLKNRGERGFTLIELLIVIAIIGILTAIAVPAFLGQREKAKVRAVESGAKGAVSDLQSYLDAYVAGDPYIIVSDASGAQGCIQSTLATNTGKTCNAVYNEGSAGTYTAFPGGIAGVITHFISHHSFKGDKSPYTGNTLFISATPAAGDEGVVFVTPAASRAVNVLAYTTNVTTAVFSQMVTTR